MDEVLDAAVTTTLVASELNVNPINDNSESPKDHWFSTLMQRAMLAIVVIGVIILLVWSFSENYIPAPPPFIGYDDAIGIDAEFKLRETSPENIVVDAGNFWSIQDFEYNDGQRVQDMNVNFKDSPDEDLLWAQAHMRPEPVE